MGGGPGPRIASDRNKESRETPAEGHMPGVRDSIPTHGAESTQGNRPVEFTGSFRPRVIEGRTRNAPDPRPVYGCHQRSVGLSHTGETAPA